MGGGDVDHGVEGIRRELNRLSIQPQATTDEEQFDPFVNNSLARHLEDTRYARRVSVGGLPPSANEQTVAIFFNQAMAAIGGNTAGPGDAVVDVDMNHDRGFALVEMRLTEEASNAMALDGILFEGVPLKIRRPPGYKPSEAAALGPSMPSRCLNLAAVGWTPGSAEGNLVKVVIPRPDSSGQLVAGVGKVFFEYADIDSAIKAKTAFREWKFDGNPVFSVYYPEIKFANLEFDG
ncbi:hypothetical protein PVAP13_8KG388700 [Panicum virgatum]|uniref:RRM domain-containing protein n=1 Tax=Panicum virgatum TaxID=38727 RepID=A0A8T0PZ40_PANVG|nr:hypothetical protein PVAP13_8KG388700 [Panicum virgatum]